MPWLQYLSAHFGWWTDNYCPSPPLFIGGHLVCIWSSGDAAHCPQGSVWNYGTDAQGHQLPMASMLGVVTLPLLLAPLCGRCGLPSLFGPGADAIISRYCDFHLSIRCGLLARAFWCPAESEAGFALYIVCGVSPYEWCPSHAPSLRLGVHTSASPCCIGLFNYRLAASLPEGPSG